MKTRYLMASPVLLQVRHTTQVIHTPSDKCSVFCFSQWVLCYENSVSYTFYVPTSNGLAKVLWPLK